MTVAMVWCVNVVCVSSLVTLGVCMLHTSTSMWCIMPCIHEYNVCVKGAWRGRCHLM